MYIVLYTYIQKERKNDLKPMWIFLVSSISLNLNWTELNCKNQFYPVQFSSGSVQACWVKVQFAVRPKVLPNWTELNFGNPRTKGAEEETRDNWRFAEPRWDEEKSMCHCISYKAKSSDKKVKVRNLKLQQMPLLHQGASVAKLSRPEWQTKRKFKAKTRKPPGRKATHQPKDATYHNWFTPFLFNQIENARIFAGGPKWSTRAIVKVLKLRDPVVFAKLLVNWTTIDMWIDRSGKKPRWSDRTVERIKQSNQTENSNAGRKRVLVCFSRSWTQLLLTNDQVNHPNVVQSVKDVLTSIRSMGAKVTVVTARGILIATILKNTPEILEATFKDGSTFRASESFVRKWLHDTMKWSWRKGTQASQKCHIDWENQCECSFLQKAYAIKEEDTPAALFVNSDQTQVVYAPGDQLTWAETGAKQVPILGGEEKRAFTVLVSVACNGNVLSMQAIYSGKTNRSRPSPMSPNYSDLILNGFILQESGTTTYWSNFETMKTFVNKILAPYFEKTKVDLQLPQSQKSLWFNWCMVSSSVVWISGMDA
jgi:hypothetical protein